MDYCDKKDEEYDYPTFYGTIVDSKEWQAWGKVAHEQGYDWHESTETGWLSSGHWLAFLNFCRQHDKT
jgi:hypothetical protein